MEKQLLLVPKVSSLESVECIINKNSEEIEHNCTSLLICINKGIFAPCKGIKDSLGFVNPQWITAFVIRTWILDFNH